MKTHPPRHHLKPAQRTLRLVRDLPAVHERQIVGGTTPKLYEAACKGTHLPEVVINLTRE